VGIGNGQRHPHRPQTKPVHPSFLQVLSRRRGPSHGNPSYPLYSRASAPPLAVVTV